MFVDNFELTELASKLRDRGDIQSAMRVYTKAIKIWEDALHQRFKEEIGEF